FASNFPVSGLRASYDTIVCGLRTLLEDYAEEEREAFFWRNAERVYRIELE
ncbi:MAG: amidohydrolase family protein, partial [Burkholderiales bacterium]